MTTSPKGFGPLIPADELAEALGDDDLRVLDIRWSLDDPGGGKARYEKAHIPGAVFIDLDRDITGKAGLGRHPLPTREQLQEAIRRAGVNRGDRIVVYDDGGGSVAARLWWLLRVHGHQDVAVLDGGMRAWSRPLEQAPPHITKGNFEASEPDRTRWVNAADVARLGEGTVLLDARAPERYRGETEPVDPVAGHIPGARNAFWQDNLGPDGRFHDANELRRRYEELGVAGGRAVVYCGSGVNACHDILALELAGLGPARLYAGSWSEWCRTPEAGVATGPD